MIRIWSRDRPWEAFDEAREYELLTGAPPPDLPIAVEPHRPLIAVDLNDIAAPVPRGGHEGHHPEPPTTEPQKQRVGILGSHRPQLAIIRPAYRHADLGSGGHSVNVGKYFQQEVEVVHPIALKPSAP